MTALTDMYIDPVTLDYVRTADGQWLEIEDSRTAMMIQLEIELGASPYDPQDGTRVKAAQRSGDPITPEFLLVETRRAAGLLVKDGTVANVDVVVRDGDDNALIDPRGGAVVQVSYTDLASGSPVDLAFQAR